MRTTLDLDETVLAAARAIARDERVSIGAAVSRLARRGLTTVPPAKAGFPGFEVPPGAPPITIDIVNATRDAG